MKFIFFYSPLYYYYNHHIHKNIGSFFEIEGIEINDLSNNSNHTFFGGVSIKIELIIQKIKENLGQSIIFTDATIFINSNNANQLLDFFTSYTNNDLCFPDNGGDCLHHYNIGVMLINCNERTLSFFENVLIDLIQNKGWDQDVINTHLKNNSTLKVDEFDKEKIFCNYEFNPAYKDTYLIYKSFINHDTNINKNFNARLNLFKKYGLISDEEYNNNYKKE
jgi:hypothetical protein